MGLTPHINMFEGSRRVGLLLRTLWVVGLVGVTALQSPYVVLHYATRSPTAPLVRVERDDCEIGVDELEFVSREFDEGRSASIQLCFKAQRFGEEGNLLIPFKQENGTIWGNDRYSSEVTAYTKARTDQFTLSASDRRAARAEWNRQRWVNIRSSIVWAVGGWFALWLIQTVIGWIVRGFLGIPWGKDHRPTPSSASVSSI